MLPKTLSLNLKKYKFNKVNFKPMMLLHEYQAQNLLKKNNVPIPKVKFNY